jgi:hypothetical protein
MKNLAVGGVKLAAHARLLSLAGTHLPAACLAGPAAVFLVRVHAADRVWHDHAATVRSVSHKSGCA